MILDCKFWTVCLVLTLGLQTTHGIECYQCLQVDDSLKYLTGAGFPEGDTCEFKIKNKQLTKCSTNNDVCVKTSATVGDDKQIEVRVCAAKPGEDDIIGSNECMSLDDSRFQIIWNSKMIVPPQIAGVSGSVCTCSTDGCNPATMIHVSPVVLPICVIIVLGYLGLQ